MQQMPPGCGGEEKAPSQQVLDYDFVNVALGIELRALHIPGKPTTTKLHPQPSLHFIETESH